MPRHELPRHTKRRVAVADVAAVEIIGSTVTVGVMGIASARDGATAPAQCLLEPPPVSCLPAPPPDSSAPTASAPPAESTEPPAEQPPAEQPPAEQPPAEDTQGEQPPAGPGTTDPQIPLAPIAEGLTAPAAVQPAEDARRSLEPRRVRHQSAKVLTCRRH